MNHFILQFFTGTMAFRGLLPQQIEVDADIPDAFLENERAEKNYYAGKAAKNAIYARMMQDPLTNRPSRDSAEQAAQKI